jgi:predicted nucleic acid-binding protein
MNVFFDTNILIYVLDPLEPLRQQVAKELVEQAVVHDLVILSTQVLGEFYSVATRKGKVPLSHEETMRQVRRYAELTIVNTDADLTMLAMHRSQRNRITYYDALMVEAALRGEAEVLYSEDMQHGMRYGPLRIENPFRHLPARL